MIDNITYVNLSLETHLFFARIMKEHAIFLEAAFLESDKEYKKESRYFQDEFTKILNKVTEVANGNISEYFLASNEIVTQNTLNAETISSKLTDIPIDFQLTKKELNLESGSITNSEHLISTIDYINKYSLTTIKNIIDFKTDVLNKVLSCKMFTSNYPLLIQHIMNEAKMYYDIINKLSNREPISNEYIYEQEAFWNNIMKEHAQFIDGLLDPTEKELKKTASSFALEYEQLLEGYKNNPNSLTEASLQETLSFRDFKIAGEEGILNCKIKSIIVPLLADHVLREANHFIRLLKHIVINKNSHP